MFEGSCTKGTKYYVKKAKLGPTVAITTGFYKHARAHTHRNIKPRREFQLGQLCHNCRIVIGYMVQYMYIVQESHLSHNNSNNNYHQKTSSRGQVIQVVNFKCNLKNRFDPNTYQPFLQQSSLRETKNYSLLFSRYNKEPSWFLVFSMCQIRFRRAPKKFFARWLECVTHIQQPHKFLNRSGLSPMQI